MPAVGEARGTNNFDFLRVVAAYLVIGSHQYALLGHPEPRPLPFATWGTVGVYIFFVISGFLVAKSWRDDPNIWRFGVRRLLRIWPALTAVTVLTVLVLGPVATSLSAGGYFAHPATWTYLGNIAFFIQYQLPGVFSLNPGGSAVNGSLWTIPVEVGCYLALALVGGLGLLRWRWTLLLMWVGVVAMTSLISDVGGGPGRYWSLELGGFFLSGMLLQYRLPAPSRADIRMGLGLLLLGCFFWVGGLKVLAVVVALPFWVVWVGSRSWPCVSRAGRWGDPSYGLYLFAFPLQQAVIAWFGDRLNVAQLTAVSVAMITLTAYLSWHTVERPALRWKVRWFGSDRLRP